MLMIKPVPYDRLLELCRENGAPSSMFCCEATIDGESKGFVMFDNKAGTLMVNALCCASDLVDALLRAGINAGYMVLEPAIFDYIEGDETVFERAPLEKLVQEGQLMSYLHRGYWQCMDTKREMDMLENRLQKGNAPWKKWDD